MAKRFKSSVHKRAPEMAEKRKLSLYPLTLETALGAALLTGPPPKDVAKKRGKKSVDKSVGKSRKPSR
jgi:hypothetical protein